MRKKRQRKKKKEIKNNFHKILRIDEEDKACFLYKRTENADVIKFYRDYYFSFNAELGYFMSGFDINVD